MVSLQCYYACHIIEYARDIIENACQIIEYARVDMCCNIHSEDAFSDIYIMWGGPVFDRIIYLGLGLGLDT